MSDESSKPRYNKSEVRKHFDEVLVDQIKTLIEASSESSRLSFNLATITCLLLAVEREEEINNFPDNPPPRYNRGSFLQEIREIGLEIDDELMVAFHSLSQFGYVDISENGDYHAMIPAFAIVNFLNNLFPGMPGVNLVAFVIQLVDEITSGRKDLEEAKTNFKQTLTSRGQTMAKQKVVFEEKPASVKKPAKPSVEVKAKPREVVSRKSISQKLARLRSVTGAGSAKAGKASGTPSIESIAKIKDVFPRGMSDKEKFERERLEYEQKIQEAEAALKLKEEEARRQEMLKAQEAEKEELARKEKEMAREAELERIRLEMEAREAEMKAKQEEMMRIQEKLLEKLQEEEAAEEEQALEVQEIDDVEERIASFSQELAIPCPLCVTGKVKSEKTAADKTYYVCDNDSCNFISWSKPYHFNCPMCKNPFLVEVTDPISGLAQGLKCPRAGCGFAQQGVLDPLLAASAGAAPALGENGKPKKKKRYVKRVKRKK